MPRPGRAQSTRIQRIDNFYSNRVKSGATAGNWNQRKNRVAKKNASVGTKPVAVTADPSLLWTPKSHSEAKDEEAETKRETTVGKKRRQVSLLDMMRKEKKRKTTVEDEASGPGVVSNPRFVVLRKGEITPAVPMRKVVHSLKVSATVERPKTCGPYTAKPPLPPPRQQPRNEQERLTRTPDKVVIRTTDLASNRVTAPGIEAIVYDRTNLPNHYQKLLNLLDGIESAMPLITLRNRMPDFKTVAMIVARASHRTLTLTNLAQLRGVARDIIDVFSFGDKTDMKPNPENVLIRLKEPPAEVPSDRSTSDDCRLNTPGTSGRRRLLHRRLLQKTREYHEKFLKDLGIDNYESNMWHPEFDLDNVPPLSSSDLFSNSSARRVGSSQKQLESRMRKEPPVNIMETNSPTRINVANDQRDEKKSKASKRLNLNENPKDAKSETYVTRKDVSEESSFISSSLLDRVRARAATRAAKRQAEGSEEEQKLRGFVSRLPRTLDAIRSVLFLERRSSLPWRTMVEKLSRSHPSGWERSELERQLDALVKVVPCYCYKVRLSRPGSSEFAFKVKASKGFQAARSFITKSSDQCIQLLKT